MFPVIIVLFSLFFLFFGGGKRQIIYLLKAAFPTGAETGPETELGKKLSPQSAHTGTRIHHWPFLRSKDCTIPLS